MTRQEKLDKAIELWHNCEHRVEETSFAHHLALEDLHNAQKALKDTQGNATDDPINKE
jgi:hypothetical protein